MRSVINVIFAIWYMTVQKTKRILPLSGIPFDLGRNVLRILSVRPKATRGELEWGWEVEPTQNTQASMYW